MDIGKKVVEKKEEFIELRGFSRRFPFALFFLDFFVLIIFYVAVFWMTRVFVSKSSVDFSFGIITTLLNVNDSEFLIINAVCFSYIVIRFFIVALVRESGDYIGLLCWYVLFVLYGCFVALTAFAVGLTVPSLYVNIAFMMFFALTLSLLFAIT